MTSPLKILSLIFSILFISPFYFRMDYPFNINPDIGNYSLDYINANWSYELGYETLSFIFREIFGFSFEEYWSFIILLQIVLLISIYHKKFIYIFAIPNLYVMATFFYGTQVRYSIACLLFLVIITQINPRNKFVKYSGLATTFFFHYGIGFLILSYILKEKISNWLLNKGYLFFFILIALAIIASSMMVAIIESLLPYTRFNYYINSEYLKPKSLSSTIYIIIFLFILYSSVIFDAALKNNSLIQLSTIILFFCLLFNSTAVLSGRLLLFIFMLEPFIIQLLVMRKKTIILGVCLLFLSLSKLYNYLL